MSNSFCKQCKGECWDAKSQKNTQAKAKARFGIIPNRCVNGTRGAIYCPYAKNK
ncbi:MAG: hypothetical protein HFJ38_08875 [Bacilli bacterium]|nr:hypothetical protein [Bacilli bacterium]